MALNFIKKVFSFGRPAETAPETETPDQAGAPAPGAPVPDPESASETTAARTDAAPAAAEEARDEGAPPEELQADPGIAPTPEPEPTPTPEAADAETGDDDKPESFPADGAMQFTPETAPDAAALTTPEPAGEEHSGEPLVAEETAAEAEPPLDEGLMPDELAADPGIDAVPEASESATEAEPEPATAALDPEPAEEPGEPEPEPGPKTVDEAEAEPGPAIEPAQPSLAAAAPRRLVVRDTVSEAEAAAAPAPAEAVRAGWWARLRQGLSRTSGQLSGQISGIFTKRKLDEDTLQDLEDVLLQADLGVETALRVTDALASGRYGRDISPAEVQKVMADEIARVLTPVAKPLELDLSHKPHVILVVGVNGTGKTTTIGKLAAKLSAGGLKVMLAAGDTFRAAAIEQLKIWGERTGSKVVSTKLGADAAGLAYEAFETARADGADVLIIDTAGRLQNRTELMDELAKVVRVIGKLDPDAPHTVLQTLDATTGQNALNQVEIFRNVAGVNGLVMTKLDGTARGGILVAIAARHKLPVYFIGVGEGIDDLEPFEAADFAAAIAGEPK
ncbi:signal recognition particle-docking protein FtsY [Hoeflea olei]|uniref:Signal recognition particle receptor FtsY n=1 Tax=Hoeflea olei TaxID=1480615 RepID=A0A1C1YZK2_9HYPH|nr:signal recognition particle-docking protein FtsY [Hoeflea olei]OCW58984.1 cell division protein FtsY [Hoeflea olei]